jgi:hypothetical protein
VSDNGEKPEIPPKSFNVQISVSGLSEQDGTTLSNVITDAIRAASEVVDLSALEGVTVTPNYRDTLARFDCGIAVFCNEVKGKSALALSRDLGLSYKSAFVLLHKLREAMAEEMKGRVVGGEGKVAEVDGGYFGGYVKPANMKADRLDRRFTRNQSGKRRWSLSCASAAATRCPLCLAARAGPLHSLRLVSRRAQQYMPTKPPLGMACMSGSK